MRIEATSEGKLFHLSAETENFQRKKTVSQDEIVHNKKICATASTVTGIAKDFSTEEIVCMILTSLKNQVEWAQTELNYLRRHF